MDILVVDGSILKIAPKLEDTDAIEVASTDLHVSMGWVDLKADFCDPGMEHKETIQSGLDAASMGGYTHVHVHAYTRTHTPPSASARCRCTCQR